MFEREPLVGTMTAQVAKIIGMRVVGGEFLPGDVLPVESDLCSAYGVSRTTVREAIKQLSSKRLIDVSPKIGTRVLPFADWNLLDRDVLAWRLHAQFDTKIIEDIYEMRLCFEPRACFWPPKPATPPTCNCWTAATTRWPPPTPATRCAPPPRLTWPST